MRKWGTNVQHDDHMLPIVSHKYDIGLVIKNCHYNVLVDLEPWCSALYVDCEYEDYIKNEQQNTTINLSEKIHSIHSEKNNDVIVRFDANQLTPDRLQFITLLPTILTDSGDVGNMEYDIFDIEIKKLETYEKELIRCDV